MLIDADFIIRCSVMPYFITYANKTKNNHSLDHLDWIILELFQTDFMYCLFGNISLKLFHNVFVVVSLN